MKKILVLIGLLALAVLLTAAAPRTAQAAPGDPACQASAARLQALVNAYEQAACQGNYTYANSVYARWAYEANYYASACGTAAPPLAYDCSKPYLRQAPPAAPPARRYNYYYARRR